MLKVARRRLTCMNGSVPGDKLTLPRPWAVFLCVSQRLNRSFFWPAGSGLSSPKSMIIDLLENGDDRETTLVYGARNQSELYYFRLFTRLAEEYDNFHYLTALSDPAAGDDWRARAVLCMNWLNNVSISVLKGIRLTCAGLLP